jgi:ketosteroid isomerase-like protein
VTDEGDLVRQMMAAMQSNDPDVVLELYADDCQVADPASTTSGRWSTTPSSWPRSATT